MKTILINTTDFLNISTTKYDIEKIQKITNIKSKDKINSLIEFIDKILSNMKKCYSDNLHILQQYPESTFYKYNDIYIELDLKNNVTWCKYSDFWSIFESEFGLNYNETSKLTQYTLGIHLKRKVPPIVIEDMLNDRGVKRCIVGNTLKKYENNFNKYN